jgi:cytochrome c
MVDRVRVISRGLLLVLAFAFSGSDLARSADIEAGRQIAERYCARCHAIGPEGESTHDEAPPFRTFGENWPVESLEEALAEGIVVGHPDMPEFTFEPEEISDLLAYLATLQ